MGTQPSGGISDGLLYWDTRMMMKKIAGRIGLEFKELFKVNNQVYRPLAMPVSAGLAAGVPLFVGNYFGDMSSALVASLGGMVFLYLPFTPLVHRMMQILCAASLMSMAFFLGLLTYHFPSVLIPVMMALTLAVSMLIRFFRIAPPGSIFLVMSAMIAAYLPHELGDIPRLTGLHFIGSIWACVVALFFTLYGMWRGYPFTQPPQPVRDLRLVVVDSLIIVVCAGASLMVADMLGLDKPYWVPVSCLAVMQGVNFRAVWNKQVQRIAGTAGGMAVSWLLLSMHLSGWWLCAAMTLLSCVIEIIVVRHYAAAMLFVTPMTIFLAEAGGGGNLPVDAMIYARFIDIVVGSLAGMLGALALHYLGLRDAIARLLIKCFARKTVA